MIDLRDPDGRAAAAGEYVLGTLGSDDHAAFAAALARDADLQAAVYAWQDRLLALSARAAPALPRVQLWERIERWIPKRSRSAKGGRPRVADRRAMSGILYRLRTGCQWDAIPAEFGSRSTCYRRFVEWTQEGVFRMMHVEMSLYYDDELNLREIGAVLDVSESRVCQIHGQALLRLKARMTDWHGLAAAA